MSHNDDYVCSEGYVKDQPSNAFIYDTETLADDSKCYKVLACNSSSRPYSTDVEPDSTYFKSTSYTSHNNQKCYTMSGCADGLVETPPTTNTSYFTIEGHMANNGRNCYKIGCAYTATSGTSATYNGITCYKPTCYVACPKNSGTGTGTNTTNIDTYKFTADITDQNNNTVTGGSINVCVSVNYTTSEQCGTEFTSSASATQKIEKWNTYTYTLNGTTYGPYTGYPSCQAIGSNTSACINRAQGLDPCASGLQTTACPSGGEYYTVEKTSRNDGLDGYCYKCVQCPSPTCPTGYSEETTGCTSPKSLHTVQVTSQNISSACTKSITCGICR